MLCNSLLIGTNNWTTVLTGHECIRGFPVQTGSSPQGPCGCYPNSASFLLHWSRSNQFILNPWSCCSDVPSQQRKHSHIYTAASAPLIQSVSFDPKCWIHLNPQAECGGEFLVFTPSQCRDERGKLKVWEQLLQWSTNPVVLLSSSTPQTAWQGIRGRWGKPQQLSMASWYLCTCSQRGWKQREPLFF